MFITGIVNNFLVIMRLCQTFTLGHDQKIIVSVLEDRRRVNRFKAQGDFVDTDKNNQNGIQDGNNF